MPSATISNACIRQTPTRVHFEFSNTGTKMNMEPTSENNKVFRNFQNKSVCLHNTQRNRAVGRNYCIDLTAVSLIPRPSYLWPPVFYMLIRLSRRWRFRLKMYTVCSSEAYLPTCLNSVKAEKINAEKLQCDRPQKLPTFEEKPYVMHLHRQIVTSFTT
jgi:hypothetical protein